MEEEKMSITRGSVVSLHYTGSLDDGTEFDASRGRGPLTFTVGEESLIPGFEDGVIGHSAGDRFTLRIAPADAYGEYSEELVFEVPLERIPDHITPETGMVLEMSAQEVEMEVAVIDVTETSVLLDANHALAGEWLTFDIEILEWK
jgi:peptidylprolyl isomerase